MTSALLDVAFPDGVPELGLVLDELDERQRSAVSALATYDAGDSVFARCGFSGPEDVAPFLAGEGPLWKPLEVVVAARPRRWHLLRIWLARTLPRPGEELTEEAAVAAIVGGLEPEEILETMVLYRCGALLQALGRPSDDEVELDQSLVAAVVRALMKQGFNPWALIASFTTRPMGYGARDNVDPLMVMTCLNAYPSNR